MNASASLVDLSSKIIIIQIRREEYIIHAHILRELNMQARNPKQVRKEENWIRIHILRLLNMEPRNPKQVKKEEHKIRAHILWELNMQERKPIQIKREQYRNCAQIVWELNMQAQILYKSKFMHISYENWTCSHIIQNLYTYPSRIEYAGIVEEVEVEIETKVTPR